MNPCTCDNEAKDLLSAYTLLWKALIGYTYALGLKLYYESYLEMLDNRWVEAGCHSIDAASASCPPLKLHPAIASATLLCYLISRSIQRCKSLLSRQEEILAAKETLYNEAVESYRSAKEEYIACKDSLKKCKGCEEEVKPECIKTCKGCGRDYCNTCFDAGIEAWELKQKENV